MTAEPYAIVIDGKAFVWEAGVDELQRSGGGRPINERFAIDGTRLVSSGHKAGRRVKIAGGDNMVMLTSDVAHIKQHEGGTLPFEVELGAGYEVSGKFLCLLDGEAKFLPIVQYPEYSTYEFTLYIVEEIQ